MEALTAPLVRELIDRIDVYETQGKGKSKTKRVVIHYRFVSKMNLLGVNVDNGFNEKMFIGRDINIINQFKTNCVLKRYGSSPITNFLVENP